MSAKLQLTTKRNNQIIIELLDNDFVQDYLVQFEKIKNNFAVTQYAQIPRDNYTTWNQVEIIAFETRIKNAIYGLNAMNCKFPVDVKDVVFTPGAQGRDLLNRLHRHFTTGNRSVSRNESCKTWLDRSNLTFELDTNNYSKFSQFVHDINDVVHLTEKYYVSDREINFGARNREYHILFDPSCPLSDTNNNLYTQYFIDINPLHYQYFSRNTDFDVWLPSGQIQGKNWWCAYFDHDNPTHWDISLNIQYSGSFSIGKRLQACDPALTAWLKSHGIDPGPLHVGMPLGNIIDGHEFINKLGFGDQVAQIELVVD